MTHDNSRYVNSVTRANLRGTVAQLTEYQAIPKEQFPGDKALAELNLAAYLGGFVGPLLDTIDALMNERDNA